MLVIIVFGEAFCGNTKVIDFLDGGLQILDVYALCRVYYEYAWKNIMDLGI